MEELTTATLNGTVALQQRHKPVRRAEIWATGQGFDGWFTRAVVKVRGMAV